MGEIRDDAEDARREWESMVAAASGQEQPRDMVEAMVAGGPPPSGPGPEPTAPLIVDTDIGGDPDDAIALTAAALHVPELRLVITTDEHGGERARFARHLLDLAGRADVAVIAGADLGDSRYFCVDGLIPATVPGQPEAISAAVDAMLAATSGPVRWVGIGPMANLAAILAAHPGHASRLHVTQMGGALAYRDPARAEHNVRLDPGSAISVLTAGLPHLALVPSDCHLHRGDRDHRGIPYRGKPGRP